MLSAAVHAPSAQSLALRLAASLAVAAALFVSPGRALAEVTHVVGKGQTLGRIAKRYGTSVDTLRAINDLKPGERIHPGLKLTIPDKGKEAEAIKKAEDRRKAAARKAAEAKKGGGRPDGKGGRNGKAEVGGKGPRGAKGDRDDPDSLTRRPKRAGFVRMMHGEEKLETQFLTRHGRLVPGALPGLSRMLRFFPTNAKTPIDPRLATLIGMVSDHFGGRTLHVVSGFRPYSPKQYTPHSNHNVGRAMDFNVEGVPNTVLRDFCRTFRNAGVGYYPNSSFVHLDVRTVKTYWVDYSKAGERPRYDREAAPAQPDEAASDVYEPAGSGEDGSDETPHGGEQVPDTTEGKPNTGDPGGENPASEGNSTPPAVPAPAAPAAPPAPSPSSEPSHP